MLQKTEGAIKNGQSRDTGNIETTRHGTKTEKTKIHNTEYQKDEHHRLHQKLGMNPGASKGYAVIHPEQFEYSNYRSVRLRQNEVRWYILLK